MFEVFLSLTFIITITVGIASIILFLVYYFKSLKAQDPELKKIYSDKSDNFAVVIFLVFLVGFGCCYFVDIGSFT